MFDEELLRRLSESPEVESYGRSELVRRAVKKYLDEREQQRIAEQYRAAYENLESVEEELSGWTEEGQWPEK